jgi:hypothetical protein
MQYNFEQLNYLELHSLFVSKNKEFTDGIKAGKKHIELQAIYNGINEVYAELCSRKSKDLSVTEYIH